jgi:predicted nucleic acid-binding protein
MSVRVVDASVLGALVFGEPKADRISKILSDEPMAAPPLIWFELASICLKKIKEYPSQKVIILEAFDLARRLNIEMIEVDHLAVIELAEETGLTTYDASYIWLALEMKGELITLDTKMNRAIKKFTRI